MRESSAAAEAVLSQLTARQSWSWTTRTDVADCVVLCWGCPRYADLRPIHIRVAVGLPVVGEGSLKRLNDDDTGRQAFVCHLGTAALSDVERVARSAHSVRLRL
jgi:hypothetical protein